LIQGIEPQAPDRTGLLCQEQVNSFKGEFFLSKKQKASQVKENRRFDFFQKERLRPDKL
jgi:hypothetical protein